MYCEKVPQYSCGVECFHGCSVEYLKRNRINHGDKLSGWRELIHG